MFANLEGVEDDCSSSKDDLLWQVLCSLFVLEELKLSEHDCGIAKKKSYGCFL